MLNLSSARTSIEWRLARRRPLAVVVVAACLSAPTLAIVVNYEGVEFPEEVGWERANTLPSRHLEDGWFIQEFNDNVQDFYRYDIGGISGLVDRFFMEWRAKADYPEWLIHEWQVPTVVVAGGNAGVAYHVVMTESAAALSFVYVPRVVVPISVGEPHTYRVEVYADVYVWYIDGVVVDSGVPEGPYPDPNARVTWGGRRNGVEGATITWDYVRFGRIPEDASGDYDSDGAVTGFDYYFLHDCLTKEGPGIFGGPEQNAGPGCRFADFDADAAVDLLDFAEFQNLFNGPHP